MSKNYSHPTILWKYGLNGRFELRIITEFVSQKQDNTVTTGLNPIVMGIKVKLAEEKGIIPATAFLGHLTSATLGSKPFHTTYIAPSFRFTMQHTLSDNLSLGYNLGSEWDGESAEPTYIYTLTCGLSVTKQLSGFIEVYGFAPQDDKADHRFDCGVTYLLNDDLVVDLSGGIGLTKNAPDHFISCGFSYRFKATK